MTKGNKLILEKRNQLWMGHFRCMASHCEVLIDSEDEPHARELIQQAQQEAMRIEKKFSRYRDDNIVHKINNNPGKEITVDEETARLLDFAQNCFTISEGLFDITSGVLRKAWSYGKDSKIPNDDYVQQLLQYVGWDLSLIHI